MHDTAKESGDTSLWLYLEGCLIVAQGMREMQATIDKEVARRTATRPNRDAVQAAIAPREDARAATPGRQR